MYPDFKFLLQQLTGHEMPEWLSLFKTFGLMVALAFIAASWATGEELKRKAKLGLLQPEKTTMLVGKPYTWLDIVLSAVTGFLLGFKVGGIFGNVASVAPDPMGYLMSMNGNLLIGILAAVALGVLKYFEGKKQELPEPLTKTYLIYPHDRIMEIVMIAAIGGLVGAKIFNALETWEDFIQHPIQNLTSSSGLTFLGGLILATACFYFYAKKHNIPFKHLCDAASPSILLAYGIGRWGCQLAGDGDWGIYNTAYLSDESGKTITALPQHADYIQKFVDKAPAANFHAPTWLPDWLFGMCYPHNVGNEGKAIAGCAGDFCHVLPVSVFPTPIYESVACILLFALIWYLRPRLSRPWQMFGAYLLLAGAERFLVELIRVNYKYDFGFIHPTQAEIISVVMILAGVYLTFLRKEQPPKPEAGGVLPTNSLEN